MSRIKIKNEEQRSINESTNVTDDFILV